MSAKEKIIAIISFVLVLGVWGVVALVLSRSTVAPDQLAQLPTQAVLPTLTEPVRPVVIDGPTATDIPLRQTITQDSSQNQIIVRFAPDTSAADRAGYVQTLQGTIEQEILALDTLVITVPDAVSANPLPASPLVDATEPDYLVSAQIDVPTSDPHYADQWALPAIGAPAAWADLTPDEPMVTVAVIDSGICADHPDLQGRILPGYDFVDDDHTPQDELGHGCSVAGVIAANADNGIGMAGVAPNTTILPLRVLDASGVGTYSDVAAAIVQATDAGATIINLSLGGPHESQLLTDAVDYALNEGVLVIAAAGNNGSTQILYPAAYAPVIAVGAVNQDMERSSFSSYGPQLDILAPGESILTLANADDYTSVSGTSLAAPHVSGAAALEMARGNTLTLDGGILTLGVANQPLPTPPIVNVPPEYDDLLAKANQDGHVRIIAQLNAAYQTEGQLSSAQIQNQRAVIAQTRNTLVAEITSNFDAQVGISSLTWPIPYVSLSADAETLAYLANSPAVGSIIEDTLMQRQLERSIPFIEAAAVHNALGLDGTGQAIAIIDDGIDNSHPFFGGRVVEEACYSHDDPGFGSLCPGGVTALTGPGSAHSGPQCVPFDDFCDHGMHVAGIAAGDGGPVDAPNGVAPNASIIAVQVFTGIDDCEPAPGSQPCVGSFTSDQITGLVRVLDLNATYDIAAVNMSLGTSGLTFGSVADCLTYETNNQSGLYTLAFTALRDDGIMPVVSAGNDGDEGGTTFPACLPTAVSVGSVGEEWDPGPQTDNVSIFSNNAPYLDLFAPGGYINSSVANDSYEFFSGTSMSAPHVAGAWALMKQAVPTASVTDVLDAMVDTGEPIFDGRNGINLTKPRINVYQALLALPPELVVNTTNDVDDGVCDATHCSLREAINSANVIPQVTNRIEFNIGGGGQQTIVLDSAAGPLPILTSPVFIDGTTQPGFGGTPLIEIDGANLSETNPLTEFGLTLTGGSSLVRGLIINNFGSAAIHLTSGSHNVVAGNYLGTEPDGTTAAPNREGVRICSSSYNLVGGLTTADRNLISGNTDDGINLCRYVPLAFPTGNTIQGNYIGLDATGDALLNNGDDGIKVEDSTNTLIGGTAPGAGNVISGNFNGIQIVGTVATATTIQGNTIGPNTDGNQTLDPGGSNAAGILISSSSTNQIGGTTGAARNLISGNGKGIMLSGTASNNTVVGNFIGTDLTGTAGLPNQNQLGIEINSPADANIIGGTDAGAGNVVSGNQFVGIHVYSDDNIIQGNFVGTDLTGTIAIGNGPASGITIRGNNNLIGGTSPNAGNTIAHNDSFGVSIGENGSDTNTGNAILGNSIFGNLDLAVGDGLGIDLNSNGVTPNDEDDPDGGSNNHQNFPVLTDVSATHNTLSVNGTLNSTPNETFRIELFTNDSCDPTGYGEGQYFLGAVDNVATDGSGDVTFNFDVFGDFTDGTFVTATATDSGNNTSEFSACVESTQDSNQLIVNTTDGAASDGVCDTHCSILDAVAVANSLAGVQTIAFDIPGSGPHVIQPVDNLFNLSDVIIDGTTQPGYTPGGPRQIAIDGSAFSGQDIIVLMNNNIIRGLALYNSSHEAISILGNGNTIEGNFIGTDATGTVGIGNGVNGITISIGINNVIGGTTVEARNIISGNGRYGIRVTPGNRDGTLIQGNFIGTDITGTVAIPNAWNGIQIEDSRITVGGTTGTTPGGPCTGACNLVSGNGRAGISLEETVSNQAVAENVIQGNFVGTDVNGTSALPNDDQGLYLFDAPQNQIGGLSAGEGNLISGNGDSGVSLSSSNENILERNLIGTDVLGSTALGNGSAGVHIEDSTIATLTNNVVAGNAATGVHILNSTDVSITGGSYGASADGATALPNQTGIWIAGGQNNAISNAHIAGNTGSGLVIDDSDNNTLSGSVIGVAGDTTSPLPNGGSGVEIINNAHDNSISDNDPGGLTANIIAYNGIDGVTVTSGQNNLIGANQINNNGALGIDLGADGVTANDVGDSDTGANTLLNMPVLTAAVLENGTLTISGAYNSAASTTYTMAIYRNEACDPSGYGEGEVMIGDYVDVVTDATGNATFAIEFTSWSIVDEFVTARISDPAGNSSEFSNCLPIAHAIPVPANVQVNVVSEIDIQIDWQDASIEETHFLIERSISGADDWTEIASIPTNDGPGTGEDYTHHDTDFLCSAAYDYRLRAYDEASEFYSAYTSVLTATPTCPTLNAPGSFTATVVDYSQIDLTWTDDNTTETSIVLQHSINNGASWHTLYVLPADSTSTQHTGLQCASLHSYRARAMRNHDSATGPFTPVETVTTDGCPTAEPPMDISATPQSGNTVGVSWQVSVPSLVTTFHLERSLDSSNWAEIFVLPQHVTSITDTNLLCNTQYHYRVRSYRQTDASYSAYSAIASATTLTCPTPVTRTVGLNRNGRWHFWETNAPNSPLVSFDFGPQQAGWQPITGDWDGDGVDGIGLYNNGVWLLRDVSEGGPVEEIFNFGPAEAGWQAFAGDFNGNGTDGIGLYKNGLFLLRQTASAGAPDMTFAFGPAEAGWTPVAGDWNNSGNTSVGLYKAGLWLLSNQLPAIADMPPITFGQAGWTPVVGDWDEDGVTSIGIYLDGQWHLRDSNSSGLPDHTFGINSAPNNWRPVANYRGGVGGLLILSQSIAAPTPTLTATPAPTQTEATDVPTEITPDDEMPDSEASATPGVESTAEVAPPTETPLPSPTPTATARPSATLTDTPLPSATPTMTFTPIPPTATPQPSPTNLPPPESTEETAPGE